MVRAVVIGAGTIGLLTLQAVVLGGAEWTGVLELHDGRRAVAEQLGASNVFGSAEALVAAVGEDGVDLAFDAVGVEATRRLAVELLRPGGCAVMVGLGDGRGADRLPHRRAARPHAARLVRVHGRDYDEALAWLLDGRAGLGELEEIQPLAAGPDAFAELAAGPSPRLKVFLGAPAAGRA